MKSDENVNLSKNFISKRSTRNVVGSLVALSLLVALFNSASFPVVVEHIKKIQRIILDGVVFSKDPDVVYHREEILNDYERRIAEDFDIPAGLRDRVGFWFDIYTRYDSNRKVIHHTLYPWVVYKVVDVTDIINSDTPKARWMRNLKADEFVSEETQNIREALKELARGEFDEDDATQVSVAKALEALPGTLQNKAKEALKNVRVQTGQKNFFAEGLEVSPLYLSGMEEIFRNHKLPVELTRIPFVESSFNRHAVSKVGASGIWQFMDYTGKSFLTVNDHIDERNSPFKATDAAARLLKENHMILRRSWPLAVTAWNHGPSGLRRAMKAAESEELSEIIAGYQSRTFDFASSNFYCEFLAALYAEKYHDQIFTDLEYEKTLDLHTVKLARAISAKELLRRSGLAKEDFVLYNPDLKKALERNASIPSGFTLMVDTPARLVLKSLLTKDTRPDDSKVSQSDVSYFKQE
nr:lytic transglycosylase domain-containing protein [uncultured Bdellovibrio sp.]